jgi:hypothetical protein
LAGKKIAAWTLLSSFGTPKERTLEKVEAEIAAGKLGIARDRLHGLVNTFPCDLALRSRLGDVCAGLGYPIEAGRFWYLDNNPTPERAPSIAAFEKHCENDPTIIFRRLRLKCSPEEFTDPDVAGKVAQLISECVSRGLTPPNYAKQTRATPWKDRLFLYGCVTLLVLGILLAAIGIATVYEWFAT